MAHSVEYNRKRREAYAASKAQGLSASQARRERNRSGVFTHPGDPLENFSRWSSRDNNFPSDIQTWIRRQNRNAGLAPKASFGYRYFYHLSVEKLSDIRAIHASEGIKT